MALGMQFAPMRKFEMNFGKDCVLLPGCRHSVGPQNLNTLTREKVCVWCAVESHTQGRNCVKSLCVNSRALQFESAKALQCAAVPSRDSAVNCGTDYEHHF